MLRRRFQLLFLATAVLAVYFNAIFSELNSIDDMGMVTSMLNTDHWSLRDLFFPHGGVGLYYRPLLSLSFFLDKELWFMESSFLHLENILLHLFNALLVFVLALKLLPESEKKISYLPLVAALLFALHPIATESVNWVSGRTDLMAGAFLLLCALSLVLFRQEQRCRYLISATLALICATLSKEVSLAFLLGAFFLLNARSFHKAPEEASLGGRLKRMAPELILLGVVATGLALLSFYLHTHPYKYDSSKVRMTFRFITDDPHHALFVFLRAFGFYLKKLYWPFPLNFAIVEIDPLYELLAIPTVVGCGYLAFRRSLLSATFLAGVSMITPAFLPAFNQVAWTPYAERYAYIASAFVTTSSVLFIGRRLGPSPYGRASRVVVPCLLIVLALATFQRNLIWRSNLSIYADTVRKSPTFSKVWNEYGVAYFNKRDFRNAEINFAKASSLYSLYYDEVSDVNLVTVLMEQGKEDEAAAVYKRVLEKGGSSSARVLESYVSYLGKKVAVASNPVAARKLMLEELKYSEKLYALNQNTRVLYRMGDISLALGRQLDALAYYRRAYEKFQKGDNYKEMSRRQIARLAKQ